MFHDETEHDEAEHDEKEYAQAELPDCRPDVGQPDQRAELGTAQEIACSLR
jgi:hypothetical protein